MFAIGLIIGALLVLVVVCAVEPNYRDLMYSEWECKKTKPLTISVEDKASGGKSTLTYHKIRRR